MTNAYHLDMTKPLTFWDYTHADVKELVLHPDYSLERFTRICEAVSSATDAIERALDQGLLT